MEDAKVVAAELAAAIIKARQTVPGMRMSPEGAAGIYFEVLDAVGAELKRRAELPEKTPARLTQLTSG